MHSTDSNTAPWVARKWKSARVTSALQGLVSGGGSWYDDELVRIERTGRYIAGTWTPEEGEDGPVLAGDASWVHLIGQVGVVALRAASPVTRPERREVLLNFLEMWAQTPFVDPEHRFRLGRLEGEGSFTVRDEHGSAFARWLPARKDRPYLEALPPGCVRPPHHELRYIEDCHRGWGSRDQLRRLVSLIRERGPMPWDPAAVVELSDAAGTSRPAAALILAGNPGAGSYYVPYLDADERAALDFKAAELESGREELGVLREGGRMALLADVLPEDPADLWEPGGLGRVAARAAEAWNVRHGKRPRPPERTWQAALALDTRIPATDLCHLFLDPERAPLPPGFYLRAWPSCPDRYRELCTIWDVMGFPDADSLVDAVFTGLPWAYADLPAGDPVRNGAPEVVRVLRKVLARGDSPAGVLRTGVTETSVLEAGVLEGRTVSWRWDWLTDGTCDRMMARITAADLPPGRYESDPRACVPDLVEEVAQTLDLPEDPAALYLQLLTLAVPSDRNVRRWNGWTPARHKQAAARLVERGLVVEDKRPRAGRGVFLPGPWARAAKPLPPMECGKARRLGARLAGVGEDRKVMHLPGLPGTLPELFTEAWRSSREAEGRGD
ncbi:hypothetical protein [Streptomyces sp. NPDC057496]|uniref:hypothetical protein n=1 Tax=Streptomyces sp. NPDC057496 TaxID=3346149 RepID=UPI0036AE174A